jgi:hypothetical protein
VLYFATFLGPDNRLLDINKGKQILIFLNSKGKDQNIETLASVKKYDATSAINQQILAQRE